jgi:hypothetical protein
MVYAEHGYLVSGLYPSSSVQKNKRNKNTTFRRLGQGRPIQLDPLERASLNHWTRVQKPNNHVQWT